MSKQIQASFMQPFEFNYMTKAQVLSTLNISERTLENLVRDQRFPPGAKLGRSLFWAPVVVQKWLEDQFKAQLNFTEKPRRRLSR